ncbi:YidC/Oxa1 family membrane protein insertase [Candidatus Dojkabacteria bacterium]|uniref:YidC/Oxa1 family membrane protein insertase n=1 Tax=Candidatus Dojkabacteria bacterium TaxID=2099670 RepID=A0A5C7J772_9BACT|nr:MAG: YidC/Oxa1 family membrane protein insertase [Candidatus Dojkabacteria bacterium]
MSTLFHLFIYDPLYNVLVWFYDVLPFADFGVAIILTTILIKVIFYGLSQKQIISQKKLQEIQPKIKALQEQYKDDKEKQTRAIMECYKEHKVNPFAGCLPLIIQLIFFIAFYQVIISFTTNGFQVDGSILYSFLSNPGSVHHMAFGFLDLVKTAPWLGALAAIAQYFQTKMIMPQTLPVKKEGEKSDMAQDMAQMMGKQMLYLGPALIFFFSFQFPAALSLYWLVSTLLSWGQQKLIFDKHRQSSNS